MNKKPYTTEVGDYLVIWVTGELYLYIAQVTQSNPLRLKVEEEGPFANLKDGDFIIKEKETIIYQNDHEKNTKVFLTMSVRDGRKVVSGLKSLGVVSGTLHEILPD